MFYHCFGRTLGSGGYSAYLLVLAPAPLIELTTSRTQALQARRSCASSLETFLHSLLHRAWPKTSCSNRGSRSALIVFFYVFSWPPTRLRHVRGGVGSSWSLISLLWGPSQGSLLCTGSAGSCLYGVPGLRLHNFYLIYLLAHSSERKACYNVGC